MKAFIKRSVTFLLALVISFISVVSFCDVPEAHATAVALYSTEQIIASLLFSLGISVQAYDILTDGTGALQPDFTSDRYQVIEGGGGSSQEGPEPEPNPAKYYFVPSKKDADAFLQQLYAADAARKPDIDAMIETAKKTGKIVIDKASGLWEYLKENVGKVFTSLKKPETDDALSDYYKFNNISNSEFYDYITSLVSSEYAAQGITWSAGSDSDRFLEYSHFYDNMYYAIFYNYRLNGTVLNDSDKAVRVLLFNEYTRFAQFPDLVESYYSDANPQRWYHANNKYMFSFIPNDTLCYVGDSWSDLCGKVVDLQLLSPSSYKLWKQNYTPAIAAKDNYDRIYDTESGHVTEIITPDTQVYQNSDGSYSVTGDYVIDMKNPVSYPVDMTDGVILDDKKTPVAEILSKQDPSTKPDPDPDPEPEPEPEPESLWERLFQWLSKIYDALIQLPQILTSNGLVLGNIVSSMSTISLAVHAIQTAAEGLLSGFDGLEIPDYSDLIQELPALFADAIEFPEINIPEIPNYMDILKQMLELLKNLLILGNIQSLLQSMFVIDYDAVAAALRDALNVWDFDFLTDLKNLFNFNYTDNYDYPRIAVKCPKILAPYYGKAEIVLCDFSNYKTQLKWGRNIIRMMIWVYFLYAVFNHFRVKLDLS